MKPAPTSPIRSTEGPGSSGGKLGFISADTSKKQMVARRPARTGSIRTEKPGSSPVPMSESEQLSVVQPRSTLLLHDQLTRLFSYSEDGNDAREAVVAYSRDLRHFRLSIIVS
jgi:hypothetical protein